MTKRKMADRKILQLLYLLYDLCKDSLEEFFIYNCLDDDPTNEKLAKFVTDHKVQLYHHLKYFSCHMCSDSNSQNSCVQGSKQLFQSLFTFPEEFSMSEITSVAFKKIYLDDLDIWTVQYLLLADNLEHEQHKWIRILYEKRQEVSHNCFKNISDQQFNRIWIDTREIILNFLRVLKSRKNEKEFVKRLSILRMASPEWCDIEVYWDMMQEEFSVESRLHSETTVSAPGFKHDTETDENRNNNTQEVAVVNVQTENIIFGNNNNVINSISDDVFKRKIQEVIERQERESLERNQNHQVMLEKFEQLLVIANVKDMPMIDGKKIKTDDSDNGIDECQGLASTACSTNEHKYYFVEWKIKTDDNTNKAELEKIAKSIELERTFDGNITIKFIRIGSIVIGTLVSPYAVEKSDMFNKTVRRFIKMIIDKCNMNTKDERILEVDVTFKPSQESTDMLSSKQDMQSESTGVKFKEEKSTQTNDMDETLGDTENSYAQINPLIAKSSRSVMPLKFDTFENRTTYEKIDLNEVRYADFPHVKIEALSNYTHVVDNQQVAFMKKGQVYYLIKQVGEWWEITDIPGPSFFVKSEYGVMNTPKYGVPTVQKQRTRIDSPLLSKAAIKQPLDANSLFREHVSKGTHHDYDTIPDDKLDVTGKQNPLRKTDVGKQKLDYEHELPRKGNAPLAAQQKFITFRPKRPMSNPESTSAIEVFEHVQHYERILPMKWNALPERAITFIPKTPMSYPDSTPDTDARPQDKD
ncbi:uncharacterized protein LOC127710435 [Mytilus californianus]|uniref:uncharacterized protein LOC127710435 n=1 Tax=Mytilus californianus TaxID=6549 RepID=UPI0022460910|nr:uncharacterized protein LOC127710435 [Mytilus californianus]